MNLEIQTLCIGWAIVKDVRNQFSPLLASFVEKINSNLERRACVVTGGRGDVVWIFGRKPKRDRTSISGGGGLSFVVS